MRTTTELLSAHVDLTAGIRAAEEWEPSYKASPKTFRRMVREEAELQARALQYLLGLSERAPALVNWSEVKFKPLQASAVPPESDEVFELERVLLAAMLSKHILELVVIGAQAGEDIYSRPIGLNTLSEAVLDAADRHTAFMVRQITSSTRRMIQRAIKQSIAEGEDAAAMTERIRAYIASPVRAEMIAQTESVTAYQRGLDTFARQSGAESSTWDALSGACGLCAPLHGVTKPIGEYFTLGNGEQKLMPPGHVRCRCGRFLNYPE